MDQTVGNQLGKHCPPERSPTQDVQTNTRVYCPGPTRLAPFLLLLAAAHPPDLTLPSLTAPKGTGRIPLPRPVIAEALEVLSSVAFVIPLEIYQFIKRIVCTDC